MAFFDKSYIDVEPAGGAVGAAEGRFEWGRGLAAQGRLADHPGDALALRARQR
jgi:hypothetical protein